MKIQLDIPKELNKSLKIKKIKDEDNTLEETIIKILEKSFLVGGRR